MLRIKYHGILQPQHFARDIGVGPREITENDMAAVGRFMNVGNGKLNCYIISWIDFGEYTIERGYFVAYS